jgi:hypothetical protein
MRPIHLFSHGGGDGHGRGGTNGIAMVEGSPLLKKIESFAPFPHHNGNL